LPEGEWREAAAADCVLTNFHPICVNAVTVYLRAVRALLEGASPAEATAKASLEASEDDVRSAVEAGRRQRVRDVTFNKGWVLHALYCAFLALNDPRATLQDRIDRVVRLGGDTDTNAAIAGSLLGAFYGEAAMRSEDRTSVNLGTILACDTSVGPLARPERYTARHLMVLADALANLG
jgi:ADP-ribosylglycohydrolase